MLVIQQQKLHQRQQKIKYQYQQFSLKAGYDTKITETEKKLIDHNHDKYIANPEFNTMTATDFNERLAQANLITKTDFDAKLSSLNIKKYCK